VKWLVRAAVCLTPRSSGRVVDRCQAQTPARAPLSSTVRCHLANNARELIELSLSLTEGNSTARQSWDIIRWVSTKYSPAEFLPFVPKDVAEDIREYSKEFVGNGPRRAEDLVLLESFIYRPEFYEGCITDEERAARRHGERLKNQELVFNSIHSIHKFFSERESTDVTPNNSLERTRDSAPLSSTVRTHKSLRRRAILLLPFDQAARSKAQLVQVGSAELTRSETLLERAIEINRKSGKGGGTGPSLPQPAPAIRYFKRLSSAVLRRCVRGGILRLSFGWSPPIGCRGRARSDRDEVPRDLVSFGRTHTCAF
jgi:hypothetical protein